MIRTCKYLNAHRGVFWVALTLAGTTVSPPRAAWGQLNWPGYPNNSAISVTSGGNVGIGTSAPVYPLDVRTASNVVMRLIGGATSNSNNSQLRFGGTKDGELWGLGTDMYAGNGSKD